MEITSKQIQLFIDGDVNSLERIYDQSSKFIYNSIFKFVYNIEETNDLVHDVYVKVFDKRKKFTGENSSELKSWIYKIAVNHTLNYLKRKKWLVVNQPRVYFENSKQNLNEKYKDLDENIVVALNKLPTDHRVMLIIREIHEKSYEEISEILDLPIGTVRSRINRSREKLKKYYLKEVQYD